MGVGGGGAHPTLSPSAEDASRRQQHPTGDPHLSAPLRRNRGPRRRHRRRRRAPGAPSPSPRWVHVARRLPGKSPVRVLCLFLEGGGIPVRESAGDDGE